MIHPIEAESYRMLEGRVDLSHLGPRSRAVVERVIHASADPEYAASMRVDDAAVDAGVQAVRAGAPVLCDVEMVRHGIHGIHAECHLPATGGDADSTRSALGMRAAAARHPAGAIVVVGCAPTALDAVVDLAERGVFTPALVVGLPVGFVGAAESKEALAANRHAVPWLIVRGRMGGSAMTAAAVNALARAGI